jgi:hypothetical protein
MAGEERPITRCCDALEQSAWKTSPTRSAMSRQIFLFFSSSRVQHFTTSTALAPLTRGPAQRPSYLTGMSERPSRLTLAGATKPYRACSRWDIISRYLLFSRQRRGDPSAEYVCTRSLRRNNSKHLQLLNVFPSALLPTGQSYHSPVLNSSCTYLTLVQRQTFTHLLLHLGNQMDKPSFRSGGPLT